MFLAVASSLALSLAVIYIPFLRPIFDTVPLNLEEWAIILPLLSLPAVVHELTKWVIVRSPRLARFAS